MEMWHTDQNLYIWIVKGDVGTYICGALTEIKTHDNVINYSPIY